MKDNLTRRDFHKLSVAAFGGVVAGAALTGCGDGKDKDGKDGKNGKNGKDGKKDEQALILQDPNVCRGLNTCKGKGKGDHECAGQGSCATAEAHACQGMNECKGQGGCGEVPGQNSCKGEGKCAVPLKDDVWKKARTAFEKAYEEKHGKAPGDPPAKG